MTGGLRPELAAWARQSQNEAMEHGIFYSALLFVSVMSPLTWSYRRNRPMHRIQRGLRFYLGHA